MRKPTRDEKNTKVAALLGYIINCFFEEKPVRMRRASPEPGEWQDQGSGRQPS